MLVLAIFAALCTTLVAYIQQQTKEPIRRAEHQAMLQDFAEIIAHDRFDNDAIADCIVVHDKEQLGSSAPQSVYRFRKANEPVALLFNSVAPDGYNGNIHLLIGINVDHSIAGVRVTAHKETPGLGDKIEIEKSNWITRFNGLSLHTPETHKWAVKKEGGDFDAFTGATITPRAVVQAVHRSLLFVKNQHSDLFARAADCHLNKTSEQRP